MSTIQLHTNMTEDNQIYELS